MFVNIPISLRARFALAAGMAVAFVCAGCGGSASVAGAIPTPQAPITANDPGLVFTLADGSLLYIRMASTAGTISGQAVLESTANPSAPLELFDLSGTDSGGVMTIYLTQDTTGSTAYTMTGSDSSLTFQLAKGTGQDALQEPPQTISGTSTPVKRVPNTSFVFKSKLNFYSAAHQYDVEVNSVSGTAGKLIYRGNERYFSLSMYTYSGADFAVCDVTRRGTTGEDGFTFEGTVRTVYQRQFLISNCTDGVLFPNTEDRQDANVHCLGPNTPYVGQIK